MHEGVGRMRGDHELKIGGDLDRQQGYPVQSNNARPTFGFSNLLDFAQDQVFSQSGPTIDIARGDTAINLYRKLYPLYAGLYAQHDWKVNKRLTLNTGLRYDYFGHWATGHQALIPFPIFTPGAGATFAQQVASGTMQVRGDGHFANNPANGWAPRVGIACDVFRHGSHSLPPAHR